MGVGRAGASLVTDVEIVTLVNAAFIGAWAVCFGVIKIVDFFAAVVGR